MPKLILPHDHGEHAILQEQVAQVEEFQAIADVFRQLGDPTRVRIFWLLCHCEQCVTNISAMLDMSSPAVSHHLRALRTSDLIVSRRDGKEVYYRAADTAQSSLLHEMIEQVQQIACPKDAQQPLKPEHRLGELKPEHIEIAHQVHDLLLREIGQRFTIEELAHRYLINPTTLKTAFKAVYGDSLAAHMKEHRMTHAAELLHTTNLSIAEIAQEVGYDSQSKFTAAFKAYFGTLPKEYRRSQGESEHHLDSCKHA